MLEEREQKKKVGKKKIDWHAFQKWEREAELREAKSLAGLMVKQEMKEESMCERNKEKQKRRARDRNLHPLYAVSTPAALPHKDVESTPAAEQLQKETTVP